jgi:ribose transport system ATP-binding protein
MTTPLVEARSISKSYGSNPVLCDVSLSIDAGEIVSLIGENGAGKSTLSKIIAGITQPDSGEILLRGSPVAFSSPRDAISAGIGIVHQELCLAENLTIAENICLGREPRRFGVVDAAEMSRIASVALARLHVGLSPSRRVSSLSPAERQLVEIARVLAYDAQLLIFDEPTSSLSDGEAQELLALIRRLKSEGISILYVSHRLPEIQEISDRVVALRDGANSGEAREAPFSREGLIRMIVGRELRDIYGYAPRPAGPIALEVASLQPTAAHAPCSLLVRSGEVVGIAGLIGSGRSALLESIFGVSPALAGAIAVSGAPVTISSPRDACRAGIALVPEGRKEQGIIAECSVSENANLSRLAAASQRWLRNRQEEQALSRSYISALRVRCSGIDQPVQALSGGNQQKVVLARCLATNPRVLLLDEPTRGVDVGARREIYSLLFELAAKGLAILFVSSELEEVLGISDRVIVMGEGEIRGELQRSEFSEHAIMSLASPHSRKAA